VVYADGTETNWISQAGDATVTYADQSTFAGTFDGEKQKQGAGVYTWMGPGGDDGEETVEKAKYSGDYKDGVKEGTGRMVYPNGDIYDGSWVGNVMEGEGTYQYKASGDIYTGGFAGGKKSGAGLYEFGKDGSVIKGSWVNGDVTDGEWILKDAAVYKGSFKNGKPDGAGTIAFKSGIEQSGSFVAKREGDDPEDESAPVSVTWEGNAVYSTA
jgi:hypothetical protein